MHDTFRRNSERRLTAVGDSQALVAMAVGGKAGVPADPDKKLPLRWAE
ncbi:hypothetical protein ACFXHA_12765 [Nocardia sp. NPDC059240]